MPPDPNDDTLWAMPVPQGEVRTAENPPSSAQSLVETGIATTVLALICVVLRIFTRSYVVRGLGADDYLVVVSMCLACIYSGFTLVSLDIGAGHHMWDVPLDDFTKFMQYQMVITVFYSTAVTFSKLSILVFYLRLSPDRTFRWPVYTLIGVVTAYTLVYEFIIIFQCNPVEKFWRPTMPGTCIGRMIPMMTLGVVNCVIDVLILVIPIRVVIPLKIPRRQKISLIFVFSAGAFVCAATIQRSIILPGLLNATDYTWKVPPQMIWGFVEINAGLVCASVPALKPLLMRYLPFIITSKLRSSQERSTGYGHGHPFNSFSNQQEQNKRRSKMAMHSYELPSRDDLPDRMNKFDDDQAKLWAGASTTCQATSVGRQKNASSDDNSLNSLENQYLGRAEGRKSESTRWKDGSKNNNNNSQGINVIKETTISVTTR